MSENQEDYDDSNYNGRSMFDDGPVEPTAASDDWRETAQDLSEQAREWVTTHPFAALGIAVATGFAVGRLVRR